MVRFNIKERSDRFLTRNEPLRGAYYSAAGILWLQTIVCAVIASLGGSRLAVLAVVIGFFGWGWMLILSGGKQFFASLGGGTRSKEEEELIGSLWIGSSVLGFLVAKLFFGGFLIPALLGCMVTGALLSVIGMKLLGRHNEFLTGRRTADGASTEEPEDEATNA